MLAANGVNHVWHYWLAVPLAAAGVALVIGVLAGYFVKVVRPRFPKS